MFFSFWLRDVGGDSLVTGAESGSGERWGSSMDDGPHVWSSVIWP